MLVVHGAGESFWRRRPGARRGLCESVGHLRHNAARAAAERFRLSQTERRGERSRSDPIGFANGESADGESADGGSADGGSADGGEERGEGGGEAAAPAGVAGARSGARPAQRVEFLGVEWSHSIRGSYTREGVEGGASSLNPTRRLSNVTLRSVPMLREFANEVILDVLFYEQAPHRHHIAT